MEETRLRGQAGSRISQLWESAWRRGGKTGGLFAASRDARERLEARYPWRAILAATEHVLEAHPHVVCVAAWLDRGMDDVLRELEAKHALRDWHHSQEATARAKADELVAEESVADAQDAAFRQAFPTEADQVAAVERIAARYAAVFAHFKSPVVRLRVAAGYWAKELAGDGGAQV